MALTKIKTGGITDNAVTDAKVADAITITGAQTGITQVGTLTAGTWQGTPITSAYLNASQTAITSVGTLTSLATSGVVGITVANVSGVTARTDADDLVIENTAHNGISILTNDDQTGNLVFGQASSNRTARVDYDGNTNIMHVGTTKASGQLQLQSANGTTGITLDASSNATFAGDVTIANNKQILGASDGVAYSFTGDTDTGIQSGGTNTLQITTGGSKAMDFDGNQLATFTGKVQISHATTPDFTLNDTGGTTNKRVFRISGGGDAVYFEGRNNDNSGDGASGTIATMSLSDASTTFAGSVTSVGTLHVKNSSSTSSGIEVGCDAGDFKLFTFNSTHTTNGAFVSDGATVDADDNLSGGLSIMARHASGDIRFYTGGYADNKKALTINSSQNATFAGNQKITKHLGIGVDYHNDTTLQIENSDSSDNSYIIDGKHTATNSNGFGARFSTVATSSGRDILTLRSGASGSETNRFNFRADGSSVQTSSNQATIQHATSYHYHQSDMNGLSADNTFAYAYMYNVSGSGSGGTTARIKYSNEGNVDYDAQWIFTTYKQAIWAETNALVLNHNNATFAGALSKGSGSFKIDHPLPSMKDTHYLVHSFTESPRADLIYRDKVTLVKGKAVVNIDTVAGMTEGTFVLLCDDVQCFTSNESDWSAVKGSVKGNILTIECEDSKSTADVAWMVVADRKDEHIMETKWTDENGKPIVEPKKEAKKEEEKVEEDKDHPTGEKAVYKENA